MMLWLLWAFSLMLFCGALNFWSQYSYAVGLSSTLWSWVSNAGSIETPMLIINSLVFVVCGLVIIIGIHFFLECLLLKAFVTPRELTYLGHISPYSGAFLDANLDIVRAKESQWLNFSFIGIGSKSVHYPSFWQGASVSAKDLSLYSFFSKLIAIAFMTFSVGLAYHYMSTTAINIAHPDHHFFQVDRRESFGLMLQQHNVSVLQYCIAFFTVIFLMLGTVVYDEKIGKKRNSEKSIKPNNLVVSPGNEYNAQIILVDIVYKMRSSSEAHHPGNSPGRYDSGKRDVTFKIPGILAKEIYVSLEYDKRQLSEDPTKDIENLMKQKEKVKIRVKQDLSVEIIDPRVSI